MIGLTSRDGVPNDIGRKRRTVPKALARALRSRDRHCRFPSCAHTRCVDAHHVQHWAQGGKTSLDNLVLLCDHHHRLIHEGGFEVFVDHEGNHAFRRLDGRAVPACGYRIEDRIDEHGNDPSAEGLSDRCNGSSADGPTTEPAPLRHEH